MVIVSGHLIVAAEDREAYLASCVAVVEAGRRAPGCLDFALSPDVLDPGRINILERWETRDAVESFRGAGVDDEQGAAILAASVAEYDIAAARPLS
jgi:quinol monooxygenase YgiN